MVATANRIRIEGILAELGMSLSHPRLGRLAAFDEAVQLVPTPCRVSGAVHRLAPAAAAAWLELSETAVRAGVSLELVSGFRSYAHQRDLILRKRGEGRTLEDILQSIAPPGFSEHHTGEAADIGCPGCDDLTASFAGSAAFRWLQAKAGKLGWTMSYPVGNEFGYVYEPWHWKWNPSSRTP